MSDFDANPFADPNASNPFSDPSVQQATHSGQRTGGVDEFNPFADGQQTKPTGGGYGAPPPPQPAVMQPTMEQPPPYTQTAAQQAATDDLQRRQEELERKAAELARKEQELQRTMQSGERKNNFPPLPTKCCFQPCFYQDFAVDIPLEFQRIVKTVYYLWLGYIGVLLLNVLACLAYFISSLQSGASNDSGITFALSMFYTVLFTPCAFVCWYRPVYKAFRSDSSFNFFVFFFIFFFQVCVTVLQCLGIDGWGTCGWINGLGMISISTAGATAVGVIMLIIGALFTGLAVADVFVLIRVHRIYRNTGASFEKAQAEFAQGVMSNRTVQQTAGNVAASTARSAMEGGGGANRY